MTTGMNVCSAPVGPHLVMLHSAALETKKNILLGKVKGKGYQAIIPSQKLWQDQQILTSPT